LIFKISELEEELDLPKIQLKSDNHESILYKTGHNLVKKGLILIFYIFYNIHTITNTKEHSASLQRFSVVLFCSSLHLLPPA
jgi:hypothetical protein